jgi:hypothetical protein
MHVSTRRGAVAIAVLLVGCETNRDPQTDDTSAVYFLMDSVMRGEQAELRIGAHQASSTALLPVVTTADDAVALLTPGSRRVLERHEGQLAWIHGPDGFVEWLSTGHDAAPDALLVEGKETSVNELAGMLSAEVTERGPDTWELRAPDLWDRTSFLEPPDGILDARPVLRSIDAAPAPTDDRPRIIAGLPGVAGSPAAALVGVYSGEHAALILDASGGFAFERFAADASVGCRLPAPSARGHYQYSGGVLELNATGTRMRFVVSPEGLRGVDGTEMSALSEESP